MRWTPRDWLERLPGPATERWPEGERFVRAFDRGAVTIVSCPDYAPAAPMAHHHHGDHRKSQSQCPYAAGAATGTLVDFFLTAAVAMFGAALILGRTFRFLDRPRDGERPPSRGPPLPA